MKVDVACFHILVMANRAVIKMGVHISLQYSDFISFVYILRSGVAG